MAQCQGKDGTCGRPASVGKKYCVAHDPDRKKEHLAAASKGGGKNKKVIMSMEAAPDNHADLSYCHAVVLKAILEDECTPQRATAISHLIDKQWKMVDILKGEFNEDVAKMNIRQIVGKLGEILGLERELEERFCDKIEETEKYGVKNE